MPAPRKKPFVTAELGNPQPKKRVVRFDSSKDDDWLTSIYVGKDAIAELGNPDKIKVTIEAA